MCFVVVKFLVTSGAMLHFNEQLQGLNNFFYLDPTWLCDVLSQVLIDSVSINNLSNSKNNCQLRKHHRLAIFINSNYANWFLFGFSHYVSLWREEKLPWAQYKRCTSRILGSPMRMSHNTYSSWNNLKLLLRLSWTESKCVIPICKSVISSFKTNLWFLSFKCSCTINMRYRYMESMVIEELYKKTFR